MGPSQRQPLQPSRIPNAPSPSSTPSATPDAIISTSSVKPNTPPHTSSTKPNTTPPPTSSTKPNAPHHTSSTEPNTPPPTPPKSSTDQAHFNTSADSLDLDPTTAAQIKQSDFVYENVLRHLDWDVKHPNPPPKPFKPFYFLQPASAQQRFQAAGLGTPVAAQYWAKDGALAPATGVMIPSEAQDNELRAWAKKQGRRGRLCPDVFIVGEQKVEGQVLVVD